MCIVKIINQSNLPLPKYETKNSAGMDLLANIDHQVVLAPGERMLISSGICIALPEGYEAQIRARSGLAIKYGVGLVNGVGTIDCDYRGEIKVPLINWGQDPFIIHRGDRIAQIVICKYEKISWDQVEHLDVTERGIGGFGHTGR